MSETETLFPDIVGQERAKRKLAFFHRGYKASSIIPHLMFIAPKGCGKTMMAKAIGKQLSGRGKAKSKTFLEINCSTIKNVKQFFNQIVIPHVNQKECTILFDEASELPKDVTMALLTILNPNEQNRTEFAFEDYVVDFNFRDHSFLFATTEAHKIFHALMDRCERIDLEEYSYNQLGTIIGRQMEGVTFEKGLLDEIATVLRSNARAAQKMATMMKTYLKAKGSNKMTRKDWDIMVDELGILPLGLNRIELQVLRALKEKKECSLTHLGAVTGLTVQCLRQDFELFLQKQMLMEVTTNGRSLTTKGHKYLKEIKCSK
jgi:Holliday junction resolvasome RuvABC ATP-dependent DNA helicase subunit